jgi:hypothetical protein
MSKHSQSYIWQPIPPTTSLLNPTANVSSIECNLSSTNPWAVRVPQHCHPSTPIEFWPLIIARIFKLNLVMWKGKLEKKGNFGDKLARYVAFEDGDMLIAPQLDPGWPKQGIEGGGGIMWPNTKQWNINWKWVMTQLWMSHNWVTKVPPILQSLLLPLHTTYVDG